MEIHHSSPLEYPTFQPSVNTPTVRITVAAMIAPEHAIRNPLTIHCDDRTHEWTFGDFGSLSCMSNTTYVKTTAALHLANLRLLCLCLDHPMQPAAHDVVVNESP
jgi:hypothetical protein